MTPPRTQTGSIETAASVEQAFPILADPTNLPTWAPGFADTVARDPQGIWQVTKSGATFPIETPTSPQAGTADYLRVFAPGRKAGAYLRIVPGPRGGSVLSMTLPIAPDSTPGETAAILTEELQSLVRLIESPA